VRVSLFSRLEPVRCLSVWLGLLAAVGCRPATPRVQLVEFQVTHLARAAAFYREVFGWEVTLPDSTYALLDAGPVPIGLALQDSVRPGGPLIVVGAQDLELIRDRVVQHGGVLRRAIAPAWRGRQLRFADPDGNEVVVWSDAPGPVRAPEGQ